MSILEDCIKYPGKWLSGEGYFSDIVISSRIRLARNLKDYKFPYFMSDKEAEKIKNETVSSVEKSNFLTDYESFDMDVLSSTDKMILVERHLISSELASKKHGLLIMNSDETLGIMVNEEDHLRIQAISSGLCLEDVWEKINKFDDALDRKIEYAFDEQFGYLTSCPTNTGTGLRCSILVHLPGIIMIKRFKDIKDAIEKIGLTIRGYYGEGSKSIGNFFQISNQITLGDKEKNIVDRINDIANRIVEHEKDARKYLVNESKIRLEDQIFRSLGILENARILTTDETMTLLSMVRLGIDTGIINKIPYSILNKIMILTQPGHLQKYAGKKLTSEHRDYTRAALIRNFFQNS